MLSVVEASERQIPLELRCPECGSRELVTDKLSGEIVCGSCGLVIRDMMLDQKPEWRAFTMEEKKAKRRVGPPTSILRQDKGLSTTFQPYKDASGSRLPSKTRIKMKRLRWWDLRAKMGSSVKRNLYKAMSELDRLSDKLHIPQSVKENAALIYRRALKDGLIQGRSIAGIMAASLYAACRLTKTPRSLRDVVEASTEDRRKISQYYRLIKSRQNMKLPIDDPVKYVPKIASKAHLDSKTERHAISILREARKKKTTTGKIPMGLAAAALYIAARLRGEAITQSGIADAAEVSAVTVRNHYKELIEDLNLDLGKDSKR